MARNKYPEQTVERILDAAAKLFLEKGFENTSIQDILNELKDLSKGAIYHHFKSKEEIVIAVADRISDQQLLGLMDIFHNTSMTGLEKLKAVLSYSLRSPHQAEMIATMPTLLQNPKFFVLEIKNTLYRTSPKIIEPLIRAGIKDGSIKTNYPKELAESISLLINIWMNPFAFDMTMEESIQKIMFLKDLTEKMGLPIIDEEIILQAKKIFMLKNKKS